MNVMERVEFELVYHGVAVMQATPPGIHLFPILRTNKAKDKKT